MKWITCFLLPFLLQATVNEPLRCEAFSGYRNDRIHWHLQNPGEESEVTYSELYRDVEFWENGLNFKVIHRDLTFFLHGSYGTFGQGTLYQNNVSYPNQPRFTYTTDGWCAEGVGYFGYAVNLTADRTYRVILTPLLGYSAYFEQLKRKNAHPQASEFDAFPAKLPGTFRMVWNGFLLGGGISVDPGGRLHFDVGYTYHFMHNRVKTQIDSDSISQTVHSSSGGNKGHTGWAQVDGSITRDWRLGVGGQIHYFFTRVVDATVEQSGRGDFSEKMKLRWTPISVWATLGRQF